MLRTFEPLQSTLSLSLLLALTAAEVPAQRQFLELGKLHMPREQDQVTGIGLGDLDGDGDIDLVTSASNTSAGLATRIHANSDAGVFAAGREVARPGGSPYPLDVDGDGDLDLLIAGSPAQLLLNDGRGNFSSLALPVPRASMFAVGDVDRDGDVDAVVGNDVPLQGVSSTRLWLNDGRGNFTDVTGLQLPSSTAELNRAIALADLDNDGDLDIVVGNTPYGLGHQLVPGPKRLYVNDGTGAFADGSSRLPADPLEQTEGVAAADVDRDGDVDLVLGNSGPQSRLFLNDGTGTFTDATAARIPAGSDGASAVALTDVDFDGDPDLVLAGSRARLFVNDGRGVFSDATGTRMRASIQYAFAVRVADVDGDRDVDLVFAQSGQCRLLLNSGTGDFVDATSRPMPSEAHGRPMVLGDVDGDGDLDLVTGSFITTSSPGGALFLNDGFGRFTKPPTGGMPPDPSVVRTSLTLADVDGDRDLDLVFIVENQPTFVKLYLNDGAGNFTDVTVTQMPRTTASKLVVGDVDGDGDVDVVFGQRQGQNGLYLNDGRGFFALAAGRFPQESNWPEALALGDVDRDGDLDLLMGPSDYVTFRNMTRLYRNDGTGTFTDVTLTHMPRRDNLTQALALGDVDRDGDLDVVLGNWGTSSYPDQRHKLYLNDGSGRFTDGTVGRLPDVLSGTYDARLVDLDDDGDLDLLVANYLAGDRLYLNDGSGSFTDTPGRFEQPRLSLEYVTGDVDADGDEDVLAPRGLLLNLHRQCDAPLLARTGRTYMLDLWSRPGYGLTAHWALPLVSSLVARVPLPPFGVLGLAPATMVMLPLVTIPQASGRGTLSLSVPNDRSLAGGVVFFQGVSVPSANLLDARFTNVTFDPLRN